MNNKVVRLLRDYAGFNSHNFYDVYDAHDEDYLENVSEFIGLIDSQIEQNYEDYWHAIKDIDDDATPYTIAEIKKSQREAEHFMGQVNESRAKGWL